MQEKHKETRLNQGRFVSTRASEKSVLVDRRLPKIDENTTTTKIAECLAPVTARQTTATGAARRVGRVADE
jgi:hypothetical protein